MLFKGRPRGNASRAFLFVLSCLILTLCFIPVFSQNKYEKLEIDKVDIVIAAAGGETNVSEQFRLIARDALGPVYSTPRIRDAIEALYKTKKIETVAVAAVLNASGHVDLTFDIKRKTQVQKVTFVVADAIGDKVTEQELMFKLNVLTPGTAITEQMLRDSADEILDYLRDRGFYQSEVSFETRPLQNQNDVGVTFTVTPNTQAKVESFTKNIQGYDKPFPDKTLKLEKGEYFSRERLLADVARVRDLLRTEDYLAPELDDPRVTYDTDSNTISISMAGKVGPTVTVAVDSEKSKVGKTLQTKLLPIKRDGTLDYSAIVEGERRLENYYQEQGYFFANVTPICSVTPPLADSEGNVIANESEFLCSFLGGEELMGRKVEVKYRVDLDRHLRLTDIRVKGTDKLSAEDISTVLASQEANILGIIPLFGYGRGYTSAARLEDDVATIRSLMSELGYRDAQVYVNQGVTPNGEDLIITFIVEEGEPTVVSDVTITGNKAIETDVLAAKLPDMKGRNYSRVRVRNAARKLSEYYSDQGYYYARIIPSMVESTNDPAEGQRNVKIVFKVEDEGKKVVINRILINGNEATSTGAVLRALNLQKGEYLRSSDIYSSEQNLYSTDAFSRVDIKPEPAGDAPNGDRLIDVIVNVEEQPPRLMTYGGGYSTDFGFSGFFSIRHANLFGSLWQGGARIKVSQLQQLVQFDFVNPRFIHDGPKRFAPLTLSAQYQRDSTVTRFFRSAFDKGTFGIVQRLDENGNPIDQYGAPAGDPTINSLSLTAETNRTISKKARSILFLRYRFEDVRLYNVDSLLVKDLLLPDQRTRISGFSATFVRDTRRNCSTVYSLLDLIAKGDQTEPCRYNASDPTNGSYLTADYGVSIPALGANIGFQKFQVSYNYYYRIPALNNSTFAARAILGVSKVFSGGDRFSSVNYPSLDGLLPISERFFAGGSNTLRGFDFDEAGPRVVITPTGTYRNSKGEPVTLDPFTVPFGGNALAVVNLEFRVPLSASIRAVPFYDGGNVFRKPSDIFHRPSVMPGDVAGQNQRAVWTHTVGLGFRLKTPVGGEFGVDYGYLLNPPEFLIPQAAGTNATYRLRQGHLHFRFSQAF